MIDDRMILSLRFISPNKLENHQVDRQLVTVDRSQQRCKKHLFFSSISNFFNWIFINSSKKKLPKMI